jgi:RNA polymerase sigma-70 factor (ECF subfamily)
MVSAQSGNESDYRQLLKELSSVIHKFLRRRFGNHHFIEDCVQEALIAVHQARHTYDPQRAFRPWLFAIVRHKAIDTLRKQRTRDKAVDHYRAEREVLSQGGRKDMPGDYSSGGWLLQSLPAQHREVLVLTKIMGYSGAETAVRLGISEGAVKVRVHRAIRKLQQSLRKEEL